jgi:hypothetical protein
MKLLYRLKEEAGTWYADCVEVVASGRGLTASEAVLELRAMLERKYTTRAHVEGIDLVPMPTPLAGSVRAVTPLRWRN